MSVDRNIQKAALLLDLRGDIDGAKALLSQALDEARQQADHAGEIRAAAFLGELLLELEDIGGGVKLLQYALETSHLYEIELDLVANELARARELLRSFDKGTNKDDG